MRLILDGATQYYFDPFETCIGIIQAKKKIQASEATNKIIYIFFNKLCIKLQKMHTYRKLTFLYIKAY